MIRAARGEDALALTRIFVDAMGYVPTREAVVRQRIDELTDDPRCLSLVWEDDETGEVLGLIHAIRYDTLHSLGGWDVISLAVAPEAQGAGIGRALLEEAERRILSAGGHFVRLNSSVRREGAHAFFEHLGYTNGKTQKHFIKRLDQ